MDGTAPAPLALAEQLAEEMGRLWRDGQPHRVEHFLHRHPALAGSPDAVLELLAEEISLRQEDGDEPDTRELERRFPSWSGQVRVLLACARVLHARPAPPAFPEAGTVLGEFDLLAELGRGGHARVFLAQQLTLGGRLVVVKLGPRAGQEHLCLARLQHSHIVPLYSAHEFPAQGLRGLCQPYFGGATLADLLRELAATPAPQRSGADVVAALERLQRAAPVTVPVGGPACRFLARASYVRAVCWLGASLADALQYAQERGLVHLDLKPSNVLLAADGQPMLLDFHLARAPLPAGAPVTGWLGGTPGYMAPEQEAALRALAEDRPLEAAVDGRGDLYALGRLLCELLGGPSESGLASGAATRRSNLHVSRGLANLLDRCLAADPARRYEDAAALAADLRRHLGGFALRGVADGGLTERWRRWRQRRPLVLPLLLLLLGTVAAGAALLGSALRQAGQARDALREGRQSLERRRYDEALDHFRSGLALVENLPLGDGLRQQLGEGERLAEHGRAAEELHRFCEEIRPLHGYPLPATQGRLVAEQWKQFWDRREQLLLLREQPDPALREQVRVDLLDLAILGAHLRVRFAPPDRAAAGREEALAVLAWAEEQFGPSRVLYEERRAHALALGRGGLAAEAARRAASWPRAAAGAWEHAALGRAYFLAGEFRRAAAELDRALELRPGALWPTFYRGCCAYRLGQYDDAVVAFSACLALAPDRAWCSCNRGLAYLALGRPDRALPDFDRALRLDPRCAAAALARGTLHHGAGRHNQALADLECAERCGLDTAALHYNLALVHLALGHRADARDRAERALRRDPGHRQARQLLLQLRKDPAGSPAPVRPSAS
jgi:tetratricopeptide (TPR) repeat protein